MCLIHHFSYGPPLPLTRLLVVANIALIFVIAYLLASSSNPIKLDVKIPALGIHFNVDDCTCNFKKKT